MSDTPPSPIPVASVEPPRRFRIPLVWIIPLVAALIGLFLAVKSYYEQGPTITIEFLTGVGLEPGKTRIKYKDVDVGQITAVALSEDGSHVVATARLARESARLLVDDTRFWVVSARVSGSNVSGLNTLLSGAYVGLDAGKSAEARRQFKALEEAPVVTFDVPGSTFSLEAETLASIDVGTPVYYRRIQAGQVTGYKLDQQGKHLDIQVFIKAPYNRFVTEETRFWNASGVDVKLGADGIQVNTESVTSILAGGLAFQTPEDSQEGAPPKDHVFRLFSSRTEALKQPHSIRQHYLLRFTESIRGLSVGAPVDFRGIGVGEVVAIQAEFDKDARELGMQVEIALFPGRMQARPGARTPALEGKDHRDRDFRQIIDRLISNGLRAQLRNGNLVTGQLYVALDFFPAAKAARADWRSTPPQLPTQRGSLDELQTTLLRIVNKLDKLPLDEIGEDTRKAVSSLGRTIDEAEALVKRIDALADGDVRATLLEARAAIADSRRLLASDAPLQQDLRASLQELARAAQALRHLADTLERHPEALLKGKPEEKP
ncbi:MlaD family protein [Zoogloea sp.]|uniref:PqiB family protein n=1 Tax=Zoogloea sp. TaxID=49181 RepID=UPI002616ACEA|nr:MlaD family protein [Zoogloea sp.]MDD3352446.1 MlaD family protein [Zoogloea sp.]